MSPVLTALLIPFLGTALGSAFVFFMKREMPPLVQKVLLGFASGVMVAASVWSLIIPSIEMGTGASAVIPPAVGLLAGFAFLLLIDYITPHIHPVGGPEGPESRLSQHARPCPVPTGGAPVTDLEQVGPATPPPRDVTPAGPCASV
jgi:ZIP family zinc transporter